MIKFAFLVLLFINLSTGTLSKPVQDTIIKLDAELFEETRIELLDVLFKIETGLKKDQKYKEVGEVKFYEELLNDRKQRKEFNNTLEFISKFKKYTEIDALETIFDTVESDEGDNLILVLLDYAEHLLIEIQKGLVKDNKVKDSIQAEIYRNYIIFQQKPVYKKSFDLYENYKKYLPK